MSAGGKGSAPRPIPDPESFAKNWDRIFGKKPPTPQQQRGPDRGSKTNRD